ncbi:hypothetical protein C2I17_17425 [Niallia circulans]|nr:hypothetical protein C2I17_17425 [Niallia circulans]
MRLNELEGMLYFTKMVKISIRGYTGIYNKKVKNHRLIQGNYEASSVKTQHLRMQSRKKRGLQG